MTFSLPSPWSFLKLPKLPTPYCLMARVKLVPSIACLFLTLLTDDRHLTKKATDNEVGIFCKGILSLISVF